MSRYYNLPNETKVCPTCLCVFPPSKYDYTSKWKKRVYCSRACGLKATQKKKAYLLKRNCLFCNNSFKPRANTDKYCSRECYWQSRVGISISPRHGRRVPFKCPACHSVKMMPESTARKRKFCSRSCYRLRHINLQNSFSNANPFYLSYEWQQLRQQIKTRDGFLCVKCKSSKSLVVHHIKERNSFSDITIQLHNVADNEQNLITLCAKCHQFAHLP